MQPGCMMLPVTWNLRPQTQGWLLIAILLIANCYLLLSYHQSQMFPKTFSWCTTRASPKKLQANKHGFCFCLSLTTNLSVLRKNWKQRGEDPHVHWRLHNQCFQPSYPLFHLPCPRRAGAGRGAAFQSLLCHEMLALYCTGFGWPASGALCQISGRRRKAKSIVKTPTPFNRRNKRNASVFLTGSFFIRSGVC